MEDKSVQKVGVYAGYINFANLKKSPTTTHWPRTSTRKVPPEGRSCAAKQSGITRAEARDQNDILHRRQTYEPVPLGYSLEDGGDNAPIWYVLHEAYRKRRASNE